jgi:hypothetical protein
MKRNCETTNEASSSKCPCCHLSPSESFEANKVVKALIPKARPPIGMVGAIKAPPIVNSIRIPQVISSHHYLPVTVETILWGYFSHSAKPALKIETGDSLS